MPASSSRPKRTRKHLVRRLSYLTSLVITLGLIGSATSCAQIIGVNKDYKKGSFAPKSWYCDASYYDEVGAGKDPGEAYCDCACGAYDPDCDEAIEDDVALVSDHSKVDDEPDGNTNNADCKVCLEDDSDEGSVCALTRD